MKFDSRLKMGANKDRGATIGLNQDENRINVALTNRAWPGEQTDG